MATNLEITLGPNGSLAIKLMKSQGMTFLVLASIEDVKWNYVVVVLLVVHSVRVEDGDNNYIAVVINAQLYYCDLCSNT